MTLGYNFAAGLGICAQPGRINEVAERLAAYAQISHVLLVTGRFDIIACSQFRERVELSEFILNELGTIPGLQRVETQLSLHQVKAAPMLLANEAPPCLNSMMHDLDDLDLTLITELQSDRLLSDNWLLATTAIFRG
jgi:hypothetical protein